MNNVKLLHIKCCFFQFFNSPVALKNKKNVGPQEKVEMTPLNMAHNRSTQEPVPDSHHRQNNRPHAQKSNHNISYIEFYWYSWFYIII